MFNKFHGLLFGWTSLSVLGVKDRQQGLIDSVAAINKHIQPMSCSPFNSISFLVANLRFQRVLAANACHFVYSFAFECHQFGFSILFLFLQILCLRWIGISTAITGRPIRHNSISFLSISFYSPPICMHINFNWLRLSKHEPRVST